MGQPTPPAADGMPPQPAPPPARPPVAPAPPAAPPALVAGLTSEEESTLAALQAKRAAALAANPATVEVRIEPPHSEMHRGGYVIGNDWVAVPEHALGMLAESAADAGVTLTQKEV